MGFGLDSIIASKVKPHLSQFFVDFTDENMSIGMNSFTMTNVQLRPDVLEQFGLPFTVYGTLGHLEASLSFSWSLVPSLTIDVRDVYLLVVPSTNVPYDPAKESEKALGDKRKEVVKYFEAEAARKEAEENPDTGGGGMLAGFITGLINSLKLNIGNIHVRYEDSVTRPKHPYSAGVILKSLTAESRDPDYNEGSSPTDSTFYKLVLLNGLGTYWNSNTTAIGNHQDTSPTAITEATKELQALVQDDSALNYFVGPLGATLKAMVTLKPERLEEPYSLPKVDATLEIEGVTVGLTNLQYTDLVILGDSMDSMVRSRPYREYRPTVPISGKENTRKWWRFAYDCVLIPIKRRRADWSWERMKEHKALKVKYTEEYFKLLLQGTSPTDEQKEAVQELEDKLDNFSVIVARKETDEKYRLQTDFVKEKEAGGSWWSKVTVTPEEIEEYMRDNFSDDQRKKIFDTVHYDPNSGPPPEPPKHPRDYVEIKFGLKVPKLGVSLTQLGEDATKSGAGPKVVELAVAGVDVDFAMLPAVSGIKLKAGIESLNVYGDGTGITDDSNRPRMVTSDSPLKDSGSEGLLALLFEKNPLDSPASKKVVLKLQPLEVVYDTGSVQKILDCLVLPPDVHLTTLKAAAVGAAKKMGANQAARMKAALANNMDSMDLDIRLKAPYVLVPEGGSLAANVNVLMLCLGVLDVQCRPRNTDADSLKVIDELSADALQVPPEVAKVAYNQFEIKLSRTHVALAYGGENVQDALKQKYAVPATQDTAVTDLPTPLLSTGDLVVNFDQCAVSDDPRLPKMRVNVQLPIIDVNVVDARLLQLLRLVLTLPLPKPGGGRGTSSTPAPEVPPQPAVALNDVNFDAIVPVGGALGGSAAEDPEKAVQLTDFALQLDIYKLHVGIWSLVADSSTRPIRPIVDLNVNRFSTTFKQRTYGMTADVSLFSIKATYPTAFPAAVGPGVASEPVYMLRTPNSDIDAMGAGPATPPVPFVHVHFFAQAANCPPELAQLERTKININVAFLELTLHQESLQVLMGVVDTIGRQVAAQSRRAAAQRPPPSPITVLQIRKETNALGQTIMAVRVETIPAYNPEEVLTQLVASLSGVSVRIVSDTKRIAELKLANLTVGFEDRHQATSIVVELEALSVHNLDTETSMYRDILRLDEHSTLVHAQVLLHKDPPGEPPRADTLPQTEVTFAMGSPTVTVVGSFLGNILGFVSSLTTPAAKRAAIEGAKAAGGAAMEAAGAAARYANDARIKLDISLDAPHIIIPKDDNSVEALLAHFGTLKLNNALNTVKTGSTGQKDAVVDEMTIVLSGVKGSRVVLDAERKKAVSESYLLRPVELKVDLARNLSSGWYRELPRIKVGGELAPATVSAASDDVAFAITCLMNLANGIASGQPAPIPMPAPIPDPPSPAVVTPQGSTIGEAAGAMPVLGSRVPPIRRAKLGRGGVGGARSESPKESTVLINLAADFTVHKLEFNMYYETETLIGKSGLVDRNPAYTLGHLEANSIVVSAKLWANNKIHAKVVVQDLIFDDTRTYLAVNTIKRFIVRAGDGDGTAPILAAEFNMKTLDPGTGLKSIVVNLHSTALEFILNMQYINQIAGYAAGVVGSIPKPKKKVVAAAGIAGAAALEEAKYLATQVPGPPALPPLVDADVNVAGIRMVVLENPDSSETNALLLNVDAAFLMKSDDGASKGAGRLHVGAHTAKYDGSHFKPLAEIIEPAELSLSASLDPTKGTEVDLALSDLKVHFSAGTLLLVSKVATSFSAATKSAGASALAEAPTPTPVPTLAEEDLEDHSRVWAIMDNDAQEYPFLEEASTAAASSDADASAVAVLAPPPQPKLIERVSLKSSVISLSIEVGAGVLASPLLVVETHAGLELKDWTSNLFISGSLDLVVAYNNTSIGVWEYIVETVEVHKGHGIEGLERKPWEVKFNVTKPPAGSQKPLRIGLSAPDPMELTVSKSAMRVLMALGSAFSVAAAGIGASEADIDSAPFVLKNFVGAPLTVNIDDTAFFTVANDARVSGPTGDIAVENGGTARFGLDLGSIGIQSPEEAAAAAKPRARVMRIAVPEYNFNETVIVGHEQTRYFPLTGQTFGLLVAIEAKKGSTYVVLRGAVQIQNDLSVPVDVYTQAKGANTLVGTARKSKFVSVPVTASLTSFDGLVFKLADHDFTGPLAVAKFSGPATEIPESLVARPAEGDGQPFALQASISSSEVVLGNTEGVTLLTKSHSIVLRTPLVINNLLTLPLTIVAGKLTTELQPGDSMNVTNLESGGWKKNEFKFTAKISNFEGRNWSADVAINKYTDLLNEAMFTDEKSERYLYFKFERREIGGGAAQVLNFYAPYWMVNHTGLDLGYRTHSYTFETTHLASEPGPRMFAYDYYGAKNTCEMRVGADGVWGTGMRLDSTGLPTGYICKVGEREYQFTVEISLTGNKLTKLVTILPRYIVTNICPFPITLKEVDTDEKLELRSDEAAPYWPCGKEGKFIVSAGGKTTAGMHQDRTGDTLLRLDNGRGGVRANVHIKETKATIVLSEFALGEVPLLFVNDTFGLTMSFSEAKPAEGEQPVKLKPGESVLHAWSQPEAVADGINWTPEGGEGTVDKELKDGSGEFEQDGKKYRWSSFSNGIQRVFVFTEREEVITALQASASAKNAPASLEVSLLLDGIGLSLVNNLTGKDVLYVRLSSTDVVWESRGTKDARYALLDHTFTMILEHGYQNYVSGANRARPVALDGGVEIDYQNFALSKPEEKRLRRRPYQAGVALNFKLYPLGMEVSVQVSQLQVDNQDPGCADDMKHVFSAVPQKGVAGTDTDAAPSILILSYRDVRAAPKSEVHLISGDVILQEFEVCANMGLIDDIMDVLLDSDDGHSAAADTNVREIYRLDYRAASTPTGDLLRAHVAEAKASNTINVFESFKIYTLKFYLTFTVAGGHAGTNPIKVLVMGLGAILANVTKVHFAVDGFEVLRMRMSNEQLVDEIVSHYIRGVISNLYLLVFKLDVLGNPFKLITGLGVGLGSLLADPVMGAMNGRFIGGVADGVTGLLDGTVGNLTDSLSKITGALGKGLEALHLRGVSDLVNVLSWGLGGISSLTHREEPKPARIRPPRALLVAKPLEPYSHDLNIVYAMERQVQTVAAYKDAGRLLNFLLVKDQLLLIMEHMALSLTIYPETVGAPTYNWAHAWKDFSTIVVDPDEKKNAVIFYLASKGWFAAAALPIQTQGSGMSKWLEAQAAEALKAAHK